MATLKSLLEYQIQNAQSLSDLLEQEKVAIANRVSKDIESLAKNKLDLINQLQQTDQRIGEHSDVDQLKTNNDFEDKVSQIQSLVAECQQMNEINGEALQRAQLSFNKLHNLMQQSRSKIGMTYNAGGQTQTVSTLGTNIKA
ncbi:flagella synthesis protein FlgN [Vibrio nigripulchritudo]|uniref:flagella synthesis protein FlgN n=1 Tax=Vibrio nigripulchritudo TaxID=28173 RepID=UPI002490C17C|nr:flagellar export chaperone FlgN [Vibrio nigripulchritudo]BDU36323.1 molecular chaperone [Vibrio nigripulchritudo]BDU41980.1 molecular chaperone [Vibrio nigripulchritudo]